MYKSLKLADLLIRWTPENPTLFSAFFSESSEEPILEFSNIPMQSSYGISYSFAPAHHYLFNDFGGNISINKDWSHVIAYSGISKDPEYALALAAICTRLSAFQTLLLHGSFVDFEGNGLVFVGPSGIGKTTQAKLWNQFLGANIVNGDKLLLRCFEEVISAYGLPWRGSSPYCLNQKAPLKGIIALRQAPQNRIRKLTHFECMEYFMPHVFLPHWDETCLCFALDTLNQLISRVPIWLLECRPDEEAVLLVKNTVFG